MPKHCAGCCPTDKSRQHDHPMGRPRQQVSLSCRWPRRPQGVFERQDYHPDMAPHLPQMPSTTAYGFAYLNEED